MTGLSSADGLPLARQVGRPQAADSVEIADLLQAEFARRWPEGAAGLDAVHRYALIPSGKLLRPLLVIHAALAVGGQLSSVLPAAVGIEGAHVGSLAHDDLLDRDTQRRGRAAVHTAFGPEQAIVAGNALFFAWFAALEECAGRGLSADRINRAVAVQARAGVAICRGAFDELTMRGDLSTSVDDCLAMIRNKTAVLLEAACRIGSILGGGDDTTTNLLGAFGDHLGICFQIRDDLLPYAPATRHLMGKPAESDVRDQRPTLPILLAHQRAGPDKRGALRRALLNEADPRAALHQMRVLLEDLGAVAAAHETANHHAQLAREALAQLPDSPHIRALSLLTRTTEPTGRDPHDAGRIPSTATAAREPNGEKQ